MKKFLPFTIIWMNLEDIILSEKKLITEGQIGHDFTYMRYLISQTLRTRESNSYCQELREGRNELFSISIKVPVMLDEYVLEIVFQHNWNTVVRNTVVWTSKFVKTVGIHVKCNAGDTSLIPVLRRSAGEGIGYPLQYSWASLVAQLIENLPAMWETWVRSLDWEDPLEKDMATHSGILAWRFPWTS